MHGNRRDMFKKTKATFQTNNTVGRDFPDPVRKRGPTRPEQPAGQKKRIIPEGGLPAGRLPGKKTKKTLAF